jgi:hypothetical protein
VANNTITIGNASSPLFVFKENDIESIVCHKATDIVGEELRADTLEVGVFHDDVGGTLMGLSFGTPVLYEVDGVGVGKFYVRSVERESVSRYKINCISIVGVLGMETHYGGLYNSVTLKDAIDIMLLTDGLCGASYNKYIEAASVTTAGGAYISSSYTFTVKTRSVISFRHIEFKPATNFIYGGDYNGVALGNPNSPLKFYVAGNYLQTDIRVRVGDLVEIDMRPNEGVAYATVNGTSHTVDISSLCTGTYWDNNQAESHLGSAFGVGGWLQETNIREYYQYKLYDTSGNLVFDARPLFTVDSMELIYKDMVGGATQTPRYLKGWKYGDTTSATDPSFVRVSQERADLANGITYLNGCENITVSGWLRPATKREQLYQILYASNVNMYTNSDGGWLIGALANGVSDSIDDDRIYDKGTEEKVEKTRNIYLTEHVYTQTSNSEVVFDGTDASALSNNVVLYSTQPIVGAPTASGLTVTAYNCNAALVSGVGKLTANVYDHSEIVHDYEVSPDLDGRDISVTGATLVTFLNVDTVMDRLKAFYNNNVVKVTNDIVYGGEMCGLKYSFKNAFGETIEAFLASYSATVSSIVKISCVYYKNYVAPVYGVEYENSVVLTSNGGTSYRTWNTPSGITKMRVVIIGGGNGGSSGLAGEDIDTSIWNTEVPTSNSPIQGGEAGTNGSQGKVYEVDITSPESSYTYYIGHAGSGGARNSSKTVHNSGTSGEESVFGNYSSSSGVIKPNGYTNQLTGQRYAYALRDYSSQLHGADGGYFYQSNGQIIFVKGADVTNPFNGTTYTGGSNGAQKERDSSVISQNVLIQYGGPGSGAFFDGNGQKGLDAYISGRTLVKGYPGIASNREPYMVPDPPSIGCGGYGGVGGAGTGKGSCRKESDNKFYYNGEYYIRSQDGGKGGNGKAGCIIIYY